MHYATGYRHYDNYQPPPPRKGTTSSAEQQKFRYDSDFDFESANARFDKEELLAQEFKQKVKVEDGRKASQGDEEGAGEERKVEVEGEEEGEREGGGGGGGEGEGERGGEGEKERKEGEEGLLVNGGGDQETEYYDKSKSFFDNISCEANTSGSNRCVCVCLCTCTHACT